MMPQSIKDEALSIIDVRAWVLIASFLVSVVYTAILCGALIISLGAIRGMVFTLFVIIHGVMFIQVGIVIYRYTKLLEDASTLVTSKNC